MHKFPTQRKTSIELYVLMRFPYSYYPFFTKTITLDYR